VCQEEAATITRGSFGDIFCSVIGFALEVEATEFIGSHSSFLGMEGQAAKLRKRGYSISNQWKLIGAGITAARAGSQAYKEMDRLQKEQLQQQEASEGEGGGAAAAAASSKATADHERVRQATEKIEQSLPAFLELVWAVNTQDISRTLREVCRKVFHDGAEMLPLDVRLRRAEGVRILGREFYNMGKIAAKTSGSGSVDAQEIRRRAEVAAMTTLAKAQGQEVTKADAEEMIRQARAMERASSASKPHG
jgi:X-domain of DnaJ-containing